MINNAKGTTEAGRKRAPAKTTKASPTTAATPRPRMARAASPAPPAGWYPDPAAPDTQRFWDGEAWVGGPLSVDGSPATMPTTTTNEPATVGAGRINFRGRSMRVHELSVEQIGVWRRSARQFAAVGEPLPVTATKEDRAQRNTQYQRLLDRALEMVASVLVDESDQDWIEDQLLTRRVKLAEAVGIISLAIDDFASRHGDGGGVAGRADRRARPKAARRA